MMASFAKSSKYEVCENGSESTKRELVAQFLERKGLGVSAKGPCDKKTPHRKCIETSTSLVRPYYLILSDFGTAPTILF